MLTPFCGGTYNTVRDISERNVAMKINREIKCVESKSMRLANGFGIDDG